MNIVQHILTALIRAYRWFISPVLTALFSPQGMCRYTPSCSEYALQAIQTHGALAGTWLAGKRLLRCHPWGACGHDPVPNAEAENRNWPQENAKNTKTPGLTLNTSGGR